MSTLSLARLMFALTAGTHFLFVALTLGLATLVALTQTRAVLGGDAAHLRMVRFWGQLYVINYAVGIVTGLLMEFQFGLAWPGLMDRARGVFGAPLAMETLVAFFIESTFLGLWIFGWDRLGRGAHLALIWVVTLTGYASAYFILVANGFLRNPVGFTRAGGELRIDDAGRLFANPAALLPLGHVVAGAFLTAGFFVAGVSAWHLRRRSEPQGRWRLAPSLPAPDDADGELFHRSLRVGLIAVVVAIVPSVLFGVPQFGLRPKTGGVPALDGAASGIMMAAWTWMFLVAAVALVKLRFTAWLPRGRIFLRALMMTLPVPYAAMLAGWSYRETGRQPWLIYGVLRTRDAVRPMSQGAMITAVVGVLTLFAVIVVVNVALLRRYARRGPDGSALGAEAPDTAPAEPLPTF